MSHRYLTHIIYVLSVNNVACLYSSVIFKFLTKLQQGNQVLFTSRYFIITIVEHSISEAIIFILLTVTYGPFIFLFYL